MAKKKLYLFSLFVATMSVLLSTVVMHHHHMGRICMVVERCQQDGNFNDEHTEHHEKEADSCRVHQLHHFVTGCKIMKGIQKQLFDGNHLLSMLSSEYLFVPTSSLISVRWQQFAASLPCVDEAPFSRRGPPFFVSAVRATRMQLLQPGCRESCVLLHPKLLINKKKKK